MYNCRHIVVSLRSYFCVYVFSVLYYMSIVCCIMVRIKCHIYAVRYSTDVEILRNFLHLVLIFICTNRNSGGTESTKIQSDAKVSRYTTH